MFHVFEQLLNAVHNNSDIFHSTVYVIDISILIQVSLYLSILNFDYHLKMSIVNIWIICINFNSKYFNYFLLLLIQTLLYLMSLYTFPGTYG